MATISKIDKELSSLGTYEEKLRCWLDLYHENNQAKKHCTWLKIPISIYKKHFEPNSEDKHRLFSHAVTEVKVKFQLKRLNSNFLKQLPKSQDKQKLIASEIQSFEQIINESFDNPTIRKSSSKHRLYYEIIRGEIYNRKHKSNEWIYIADIEHLKFLRSELSEHIVNSELKDSELVELANALNNLKIEKFINILKALFASIPYAIYKKKGESYFHSNVHIILKLLGYVLESEVITNIGRIDSIIQTEKYIYIVEFKLNKVRLGFRQIKNKKYHEKYLNSKKKIYFLVIAFSSKERNITNYKIEKYGT